MNAGISHSSWDLDSTYATEYAYECVASYGEGGAPLLYEDQSQQAAKNSCYSSFVDTSEVQAISLLPENFYDFEYVHGWEVTEYTIRIDDVNEINKLNFNLNTTVSRGEESVDCNDVYVFVYNNDELQWEYVSGIENIDLIVGGTAPSQYETINFQIPMEEKYLTSRSGESNNDVNFLIAGFDVVIGQQPGSTLYVWNMDGYGSYAKASSELRLSTASEPTEEPLTATGVKLEFALLIAFLCVFAIVKSSDQIKLEL